MPSATRHEPPREVWTSEKGSMARETAITRWPGIVQNMIDDVEATFGQSENAEHIEEGRRIQATLRIVKDEIMQDKRLQCVPNFTTSCYYFLEMTHVDSMSFSPLSSDGRPDIESYNAQLEAFGNITWHNCPWLFAECYLYRYVRDSRPFCLSCSNQTDVCKHYSPGLNSGATTTSSPARSSVPSSHPMQLSKSCPSDTCRSPTRAPSQRPMKKLNACSSTR